MVEDGSLLPRVLIHNKHWRHRRHFGFLDVEKDSPILPNLTIPRSECTLLDRQHPDSFVLFKK